MKAIRLFGLLLLLLNPAMALAQELGPEPTLQDALEAMQEGRFRRADEMISALIASSPEPDAALTYYSARAAYGRGQYKRARDLVGSYLALPEADQLFRTEAQKLAASIDTALAAFSKSEQSAFEFARSQHTIFAYAAYRDQYPTGANVALADAMSFNRAKELNQEAAYIRYLDYWPTGKFMADAKRAADTSAFRRALQQNTILSFRDYLHDYPDGIYKADALQREELLAFSQANRDGSVDALKAFLASHPNGPKRAAAQEALAAAIKVAPLRDLAGPTVTIPGGTLARSRPSQNWTAGPQGQAGRLVEIRGPFRAMIYEVTFALWDRCVADGGCGAYVPSDMGWGRGRRPVINVSRADVDSFVQWFNGRWQAGGGTGTWQLPSEAEWTYMARGMNAAISMQRTAIENANPSCTVCEDLPDPNASYPVGQFTPNSFGLYDMLGNVGEWVADCWLDNITDGPLDGSAYKGDGTCTTGVVRGSTNSSVPVFMAVQVRRKAGMADRSEFVGFRLIHREPPGTTPAKQR